MKFYELFAGMSAVSWRLHGANPPVKYKGGKRGYAAQIIDALGVPADAEIVLVEADRYVADALRVVWTPELRAEAIGLIESWEADEATQRERWEAWRLAAHADGWGSVGEVERGARWLWMRPRTVAMQDPPLCAKGNWMSRRHRPSRTVPNGSNRWGPATPADKLRKLPTDARATVIHARAEDVQPEPGAIVYCDPPYDGTSGYREGSTGFGPALDIAERWSAAGSVVGVSSHVPLRMDASVLSFSGARGRKMHVTAEYLSIWRPA